MNDEKQTNLSGWDLITAEAERVYPNQTNPKHYGTLVKYKLGGKDPLDGISIYDGGDYWHFVTYGLSELYEKETDNKDISGYGMEFTFKLKKDNYEDEEAEIRCICGILQSYARYTFSRGELFNEYEYIYSGQTTGIDVNQKSNITGFITIPDKDFKPIDTPNGRVKFVEFIGATDEELKSIIDEGLGAESVKRLYEKLGSDVTDYNRASVIKEHIPTQEERREKTNKTLNEMGIDYIGDVKGVRCSSDVQFKNIDEICKRAIVSALSGSIAFASFSDNFENEKERISGQLEKLNLMEFLNDKEKGLFNKGCTKEYAASMIWEFEACWSLLWTLGIVDDAICKDENVCDAGGVVGFMKNINSYADFRNRCRLRKNEDILDMVDFYYQYYRTIIAHRKGENVEIGKIREEAIPERRRAFEWIISDKNDWFDISLDI